MTKEVIKLAKTEGLYIQIDSQIRADVEAIYANYGMSIDQAVNIFLHQSKNLGGLPFDLRPSKLNETTLAAMREADEIINLNKARFNNAEDLIRELNS